jgi:transcriptional regulator GlxA family with amidase domain
VSRVLFLLLPGVELLDFAGPLQALHEAVSFGCAYQLRFCSPDPELATDQGPGLSRLEPLPAPEPGDLVFIPGSPAFHQSRPAPGVLEWLWQADRVGVRFFSICTGAFLLAEAGLLDGRECTTHWAYVEKLQQRWPQARVLGNRLFVSSGPVTSSAGIVAGVDMTLDLLELEHGPVLAARVARELVVYLRRDGAHGQHSVYLDYRGHLHQGIHQLQDWLVAHPAEDRPLAELARMAAMSVRNFTRQFRACTGIPVQEYRTRLRLERARDLMRDPALTLEAVAGQCGFGEARRLRRLWRQTFGTSPSAARGHAKGSPGSGRSASDPA